MDRTGNSMRNPLDNVVNTLPQGFDRKSQNGDYTIAFVSPLPTSVLISQFAILDACKAGILAWK